MIELRESELDQVSGGNPLTIYYGLRAAGGALIGAGATIAAENAGDGLGWDDWDEVLIGAGGGAIAGLGFGAAGHANKFLK